MTPEIVAILSVGVALVVIGLIALQIILKRIERLEDQLNDRFERIETRIDRLEDRMAGLEQRQSRLEGMLDGLREALFERASR